MHLAPACGTASRAREKKLTSLANQGFRIPGPLRSQKQPMGINGLSGLDKVRTETANIVYAATAKLIEVCYSLQILCPVENPENSLLWFFPEVATIIEKIGRHSVSFHNCMYGGARNKLTKWWALKLCEFLATKATAMPSGTLYRWGKIAIPYSSGSSIPYTSLQTHHGDSFGIRNATWSAKSSHSANTAASVNHDLTSLDWT